MIANGTDPAAARPSQGALDARRPAQNRGGLRPQDGAPLRAVLRQVFRYAIATGRADYDFIPQLRGALKPRNKGDHSAITANELPELLPALNKHEFTMSMQTRIMLRPMMVFLRTCELTPTQLPEIDFENEAWIIK
jgi:integrase